MRNTTAPRADLGKPAGAASVLALAAAHSAGCSGHEDRVVVFMFRRHVADLGLRSKDELATRRALERTAGGTPGGFARLVCFASSRARGDASGAAEFLWGAVPVSRSDRIAFRRPPLRVDLQNIELAGVSVSADRSCARTHEHEPGSIRLTAAASAANFPACRRVRHQPSRTVRGVHPHTSHPPSRAGLSSFRPRSRSRRTER